MGPRTTHPAPFHCINCGLDFADAYCDFCGRNLMPTTTTGDSVATQEVVRPSTTDGALIPGKESRAVRPKGGYRP